MRGTFDWGVLDEKRTHPNTNIEGPKWDFNPPSVIMCHNRVGAVAYVGKVCLLKSKAAECTKEDPCKILAIGANSRPLRRIYSLVFRHRKKRWTTQLSCTPSKASARNAEQHSTPGGSSSVTLVKLELLK